MIIGLSGTGKTTTTFTTQNGSEPVQDDFVGLMPGGHAYGTENGCFAKTFSLDPDFEPSIYGAVVKPTTYLENAYQDDAGNVELLRGELHAERARGVRDVGPAALRDARNVGPVDYLLILNRNENIIPAVAKLYRSRPPRTSCSARPRAPAPAAPPRPASSCACPGRTRSSRSARAAGQPASSSCSRPHPIETYLLNTGRVGGKDDDDRSKKLKIPHTSACVKGIAEGSDHVDRGRGLRLPGGRGGAGDRRRGAAPAAPAVRAPGPGRGVHRDSSTG